MSLRGWFKFKKIRLLLAWGSIPILLLCSHMNDRSFQWGAFLMILGEMIRDNVRDGGEFQLTHAQEIQRQREGYLALEMTAAQRFDFGVPDDFVASVQAFRCT